MVFVKNTRENNNGIPETCLTDNGPQFTSRKFEDFSTNWAFTHKTSSPNYPRSNGLAERTVQTVKNLLKKAKEAGQDPYLALLTYRDTPRESGLESPAQLLLGRRLRSQLPILAEKLLPKHPNSEIVHKKLLDRKNVMKKMHYRHSRQLTYKPLEPGDQVRVQNDKIWTPGEVVAATEQPRSYQILTPTGKVLRRNRSHIKKIPDSSEKTSSEQLPPVPIEENVEPNRNTMNVQEPSPREIAKPVTVTKSGRVVKPNRKYHDFVK